MCWHAWCLAAWQNWSMAAPFFLLFFFLRQYFFIFVIKSWSKKKREHVLFGNKLLLEIFSRHIFLSPQNYICESIFETLNNTPQKSISQETKNHDMTQDASKSYAWRCFETFSTVLDAGLLAAFWLSVHWSVSHHKCFGWSLQWAINSAMCSHMMCVAKGTWTWSGGDKTFIININHKDAHKDFRKGNTLLN